MRLSLATIAALATLLVLPTTAAPNQPATPRSSVSNAEEIRQAYRSRQASTQDVVRRQKEGKMRKRQDPSNPACQQTAGQNAITNGDFQTNNLSPWTPTTDSGMNVVLSPNAGVGQSVAPYLYGKRGRSGRAASLVQTGIPVCAGYSYSFAAYIGKESNDATYTACTAVYTVTGGGGYSQVVYSGSPCSSGECTVPSGGFKYQAYTYTSALTFSAAQAASGVTLSLAYDCPSSGGVDSFYYPVDNIQLSRV